MHSPRMPCNITTQQHSLLDPPLPLRGETLVWTGLAGDSLPLALASMACSHSGPLIVITENMQSAEILHEQYEFFAGDDAFPVVTFPDWETLPYDNFSPHQDIISDRLATLYRLPTLDQGVLIIPAPALLQRLPPKEYIYANSLLMKCGDELDLEEFRERLDAAGYSCVTQVLQHGEFAVRGSLVDLYPMGCDLPYRIDLFDCEIESIRTFDPETQLSAEKHENIRLLPAREFPLDKAAVRGFRQRYRAAFEGDPQAGNIYREVSDGNAPAGIEYYLPLFFEKTCTLFDYLPESACIIKTDRTAEACELFEQQCTERYENRRHDPEKPVLAPQGLYMEAAEVLNSLAVYPQVEIASFRNVPGRTNCFNFNVETPGNLKIRPRGDEPAAAIIDFLDNFEGKVLLTAESTGRRESLLDQFRGIGLRPKPVADWNAFRESDHALSLTVAPLEHGLILESHAVAIITETALFGERAKQSRRRRPSRDPASIIRNLTDLDINAPVVHEEHGVGRYLGLEIIETGSVANEYLTLEYAGGDKLYVPVASLQLVSRYTGATPESAPLHKLGSEQWSKARRKAAQRIHDVAAELLDIHARRAAREGHAYTPPGDEYAAFSTAFPFEETPDQEQAIAAVLQDMQSTMPMDRLVCGDVGFGKTEVAMRAAFLAVQGGKQVAILVPTTLLAQQHFQNFCDRFSEWPIRIEMLSRFRTGKQQNITLEALEKGTVDIVIGTHKLLQPSVKFGNLGLLIIDEEHRFGVRQKERIKNLRSEVDILNLTATPIPRTLNMSLSGMRDLSIIGTPPMQRLAVKTFVCEWDKVIIREACLREIKRGGQIYFLHNEVETIERMAEELAGLIPEASIEIAHGQMREQLLERVMLDFYHRRFNMLLCSTIIESGIDVPTANTIIINRADKLGLAQLHQLRGRVGRSHHRAYAYLIRPELRAMSADAAKRLAAVESMEELGAGFTLATHDLEIRGAGELLGEDQSGQIHEIGYTLYSDLLERAVTALKQGRSPELMQPMQQGPEIDLSMPALLPDDYISDVHSRLVLYKRIAGSDSKLDLRELQIEIIDRFGLLPEPAKNLFKITELKLLATSMGIKKIDMGSEGGHILFAKQPNINTEKLIELIQEHPETYRFKGGNKLKFSNKYPTESMRFDTISGMLRLLVVNSPGYGGE